jgi:hypothetical protein
LINNRQNGRRRGRGGGGPRPNNAPSPGNRQDNRQRGNAAQLHEKYKAMARDAQMAGDRVQTEYYLQFADHYFRILNETRARFEEQRPRRDDFMSDEDEDGDENGYAADGEDEVNERPQQLQQPRGDREFRPRREFRDDREQRPERESRPEREPRADRDQRPEREPRGDREQRPEREPRADREQRPERESRGDGEPREVRAEDGGQMERTERRPRRRERPADVSASQAPVAAAEPEFDGEGRLSLDVLPPAIAADIVDVKPRRRTRRPRPDGEAEIAPAA